MNALYIYIYSRSYFCTKYNVTYRMNTNVVKSVLRMPMEAKTNGTNAQGLVHDITSAVSFMQLVFVSSGAYPGLQLLQVSLNT